jgi:hypothetical protein
MDVFKNSHKIEDLHCNKSVNFLENLLLYISSIKLNIMTSQTASVVYWSEFLPTNPEVPGSIPGTTKFS